MTTRSDDEAMLNYLAGEEPVLAAARRIWDASGRIVAAQRDLNHATKGYQAAVASSGIPSKHVERIGAALILRLNRASLLHEVERGERHRDSDPL